MASENLINAVNEYDKYAMQNGIDEKVIDAYVEACNVAIINEKDIEWGLALTKRVKGYIENFVFNLTGGSMWDLEKYCFAHGTEYEILKKYYKVLLLEAQNFIFDSYLRYLEKKREPKDRFYMPKRKQFMKIGLIDAFQKMIDDELDILTISMPPGVGKLLSDDTPVLTANGWKKHGNLVVGDMVYSIDGKLKRVQHVFPKDYADCLVTFSNGEQIKCHHNHEWYVYDRSKKAERIIETHELFRQKIEEGVPNSRGHRYFYALPLKEPFKGQNKKLPVDPYVLGAWLGDGTEKAPAFTICNTDTVIVDEIKKHYELARVYEQKGCKKYSFYGLRADLRNLNMCHSRKKLGKRIPDMYLNASLQQRLELLAGLIDTDGYINDRKYTYSTSNEELKDNVIELVSTFGWRCCVIRYDNPGTYGCNGPNYKIQFLPTIDVPCRVARKQMFEHGKQKKISIVKVEKIKPEQGNCIQVEGGIYCVGKTMLPTHNSTIEKFFNSAIIGWYPKSFNLFFSHSGDITRMYYDGVYDIVTNEDEYTWQEIFPRCRVTSTNAKMEQFNINGYKPFPSLQCTSVGSKNAGKVRANKFLLCDDLIGGIEEALNINTLNKLWNIYTTDARQRKIDGCKEIHVATLWSNHDIISRLRENYGDNPRFLSIAIPDIDEETGESNFDYEFDGFSKEFFEDQAKLMDDITYNCLYKSIAMEREGLLFPEPTLRRYTELPEGVPEEITGQCDHKGTGTDFMFMPALYKYGEDYYVVDCVCNKESDYEIQYESIANLIVFNKMQNAEFESNMGGDRVSQEVNKRVIAKGWICNIIDTPTESNKEARIFQCANWVKQHIVFKDKSLYSPKSDYATMMSQMFSYTVAGKNPNDDIPDCFSNFALRVTGTKRIATVQATFNPFRGNR